ncbi:hypothetical protein [Jeongeupia naejangsanensis]|nr:hypothetical protein [Jeongeupia naejangsanensis]
MSQAGTPRIESKPMPIATLLKFNAPLIACVVMLLAYAVGAFG